MVMGHILGCRKVVELGLDNLNLTKNPILGSRSHCLSAMDTSGLDPLKILA